MLDLTDYLSYAWCFGISKPRLPFYVSVISLPFVASTLAVTILRLCRCCEMTPSVSMRCLGPAPRAICVKAWDWWRTRMRVLAIHRPCCGFRIAVRLGA